MAAPQLLKNLASLFKGASNSTNSGIFSFISAQAMPRMAEKEFLKSYRSWVYACTNAIAERFADIEIKLQRIDSDGEWQDVDNHPAMDLLHDVNDFMSFDELVFNYAAYQELDGNSFWYLPQVNGKPSEIWPLDPSKMQVVKSEKNFIAGYVFTNDKGVKIPFSVEEIIHFKRFNPINPYRGVGTVEAAAMAIDTDTYSAEWQRNFFGNSAMPSGVLSTEGTLNQDQYDRIKSNWESKFKGVQNAHKLAVLEGNLKFTPVSPTSREMQFTESRKNLRDEILAIFKVSKIIIGITEDVNLASAQASEYVFAKYVVRPKMKAFISKLTEFYLPLWGIDQKEYRLFFTDPVPEDLAEKRLDRESGIKNYYLTPNEARAQIGLEGVEGGDDLYIPSLVIPLDESGLAGQPPDNQDNSNNQDDQPDENEEDDDQPKKAFRRLPLKSKVAAKKKARERKLAFQKAMAQRSQIVERAIPQLKKRNIALNEQLKTLLLENLQKAKTAKHPINKGLERLKDITDPSRQLLTLAFAGFDQWVGILLKSTQEGMSPVFDQAGKVGLAEVNVDVSFDLANPRAVRHLKDHALENTRSYSDTMKEDISQVLRDAMSAGESIDEMSGTIGQFFTDQEDWRAERLARTETIDAYAQGNLEGYRQSGVVVGKSWLADAEAIDDVCVGNADAGVIALDDNFPSGDDAPPGHPNCECALQPEVSED